MITSFEMLELENIVSNSSISNDVIINTVTFLIFSVEVIQVYFFAHFHATSEWEIWVKTIEIFPRYLSPKDISFGERYLGKISIVFTHIS